MATTASSHGIFFFADIQQNQVDAAGLAVLRFMAAQEEGTVVGREAMARQFPDELNRTLDLLLRRGILEARSVEPATEKRGRRSVSRTRYARGDNALALRELSERLDSGL